MRKFCQIILGLAALAAVGCATPAKIDKSGNAALKAMSDQLISSDQLSFTATRVLDPQLVENPAIIRRASIAASVDRPSQAKAIIQGDGKKRTFYISKDGSAIHDDASGHYVRIDGKRTIDKSLDFAAETFGVHIPLQDFLSNHPYLGFRIGSDTIAHAGTATVRGQACDVLHGTREDLTWKLWIGTSDHLPQRFTVTVTELKGADHLVIDFKSWDLTAQHPPGSLKFVPAEGDSEIQFLPAEEETAAE